MSPVTDLSLPPSGPLATANARLVRWLPALVPAQVLMALWVPVQLVREGSVTSAVVGFAVANQLLFLLRALPLLGLLSWPLAMVRSPRWALGAVGTLWALFLMLQSALERYYLMSRVPLGADLYAYSLSEIRTTSSGTSAQISVVDYLGVFLPVVVLCVGLWWLGRRSVSLRPRLLAGLQLIGLTTWALPLAPGTRVLESEAARTVATSKMAYFIADSMRWWLAKRDLQRRMDSSDDTTRPADSVVAPAGAAADTTPTAAPAWSPTAAPVWSPSAAPVDTGPVSP